MRQDAPARATRGALTPQVSAPSDVLRGLLWAALIIEAFLLAVDVVAPLGGVTQSVSPLARAWPWLLAPSRALFGDALVAGSVPGSAQPAADAAAHARRQRWRRWLVLGVAAILGLTLVLSPSLPSDDIFSYILYGRISAVHHANPLITTPATFTSDPFLPLVFWRNTRSVYGPVWLLLSGGLSLLAQALGGSLAVYVALFKLLGLLAHLANALLVWRILGRLAPRRQLSGTLFYAWNPLCLLEFCASGHNDAVMLTLLLLGVYCLLRGSLAWEVAALVAFGLSVATKYAPLILLPSLFVAVAFWLAARLALWERLGAQDVGAVWRRVGWRVALGVTWRAGVVALTLIVTALPYWAGAQTFGALLYSPPAQQLDNSLLESLSWPLRWLAQGAGLSLGQARTVVETSLKLGALAAFALLWLWSFRYVVIPGMMGWLRAVAGAHGSWRRPRRPMPVESRDGVARQAVARQAGALPAQHLAPGVLLAWGWVLLWYSLVASGWFWPWYVTWVVAVVALLPWGRLSVATLLLAGSALTLYAFLPLQSSFIYGYRSFFVFGPAWAYLLWGLWRTRARWAPARNAVWRTARRALAALGQSRNLPTGDVSRETLHSPGAN